MTQEERYWFRCACSKLLTIAFDQAVGNLPIKHLACGYEETGIVTPMTRSDVPPGPDIKTVLTPIM